MQATPRVEETLGDRPFFIVGAARSGTTLLRVLLDRHPQVAVPPEGHFIPRLYFRRERYGQNGLIEHLDVFLRDLAREQRFREWDVPIESVRLELAGLPTPTFAQGIAAAYRAYARQTGKPRWGDKTPRYVYAWRLLNRLFPDALFVHLLRDGRDVALSVKDGRGKRPARTAYFWARAVRTAREAERALGPARYVEVRYEDLVADQRAQLERLCAFLGLGFDPVLLEHDGRALERLPAHRRAGHTRLTLPPTKGLRDWRTQMSRADLEDFEAIAAPILRATGYEVASAPGLRARARARSHVILDRTTTRARRLLGGRAEEDGA